VGSATGAWPRLDGAPNRTTPEGKSYDANRRKMANYLGLDSLFTARTYCQSVQESNGKPVLVNSAKNGDILSVKAVPDTLADKPWFKRRIRFPREYSGVDRVQLRVEKLSYMIHILVQYGIPSRRVWKGLKRLSKTWFYTKFKDMRKHIHHLTQEVIRSAGETRSPWMPKQKAYPKFPRFLGDKVHENGMHTPLWSFVTR